MTTTYNANLQELTNGWLANPSIFTFGQTINSAATMIAYAFIAQDTQLTDVRMYVTLVQGSLATTEIPCQVYSDSGLGVPGTALGTPGSLASPIAQTAWNNWTGMTNSLTYGVQYYLVFTNVNSSPASNYCTLSAATNVAISYNSGTLWGSRVLSSTNSGSTWGNFQLQSQSWRGYNSSSSKYFGLPTLAAVYPASNERIQNTTELGVQFTTIKGSAQVVNRVGFGLSKIGTPGNLGVHFYDSGFNLLYSSPKIPNGEFDPITQRSMEFWFNSPITLSPNTPYYAMLYEDGNSSGTNYFQPFKVPIDTDTNSTPLRPFNGSLHLYKNLAGSFSEVTGYITPFWIGFSNGQELAVGAGGPQFSIPNCG